MANGNSGRTLARRRIQSHSQCGIFHDDDEEEEPHNSNSLPSIFLGKGGGLASFLFQICHDQQTATTWREEKNGGDLSLDLLHRKLILCLSLSLFYDLQLPPPPFFPHFFYHFGAFIFSLSREKYGREG